MKPGRVALFLLLGCGPLMGQAAPTASRRFDVQVGGDYVVAKSDYGPKSFKGGGLYSTVDFSSHFGGEVDFRQVKSSADQTYERTYEFGGRYHRTYGSIEPYLKALYGRGVFNFVDNGTIVANLAYNEIVLGGGVDLHLLKWLSLRGDYEYQRWLSFPPNGLTPQLVSFGVAYHFPGDLKKGNRFR
jgi:hypothetical protein